MTNKNDLGLNWKDYCDYLMDIYNVGIRSNLEKNKHARPVIYFVRTHTVDFEDGSISRSYLKIGKSKFPSNMIRKRNQAGGTIRIYGEIVLDNMLTAHRAERLIKTDQTMKCRRTPGPDNQTELYNYKDNELLDVLDHTTKLITYNIDTIICSATLFAGGVNNITNVNVKPPPKKPFDNLFA